MSKNRLSKRNRPTVRGYSPAPGELVDAPADKDTDTEIAEDTDEIIARADEPEDEDEFAGERTIIDPRTSMTLNQPTTPMPARGERSGKTLPAPAGDEPIAVPVVPQASAVPSGLPKTAEQRAVAAVGPASVPSTRPGKEPLGPPPPAPAPAAPPPVEIEILREEGSAQLLSGPWRMYEVWTQNRIYVLDQALVCVDVVDRDSGRSEKRSKIRGSRLMGGQLRHGTGPGMEISHPLPRLGANAVFELQVGKRVSFSETSPVTRVLLRLRVVDVAPDQQRLDWTELTGAHRLPP